MVGAAPPPVRLTAAMARTPRLHVGRLAGVGCLQPLEGTHARHLRALRVGPGDLVELFDGAGHGAWGRVETVAPCPTVRVLASAGAAAAESPLKVVLVQALPAKLPRFDAVVRMATELGVAAVVPVVTARTRLPGGGAATLARRGERWRRLAAAATEQCGRALVPRVDDPVQWRDVPWGELPSPRLLLEPAAAEPLAVAAAEVAAAATLFVGPEGGFSPAERARLEREGARGVSLGPRILRADTAGAVAVALLQFARGDLGGA